MNPLTATVGALVLALGTAPKDDAVVESVDLIEVNHFYDEQGQLVFEQCLFYDWSTEKGRYMLRAWRLVRKPEQLPQRDWNSGGYIAVWEDGLVLREVRSDLYRETWTQHDPELAERKHLPKERRPDLLVPRAAARTAQKPDDRGSTRQH